ncbi:hypothetical protein L6164_002194 [Bauhinia variegata]|uniref:Uncharacterized protein n=1 Tax=Bauhinia variegata TaxID=167791 RepID=A0ACB9PXF4_BAUVA|nr:hypothetical protein L6164_002194 [Bauhinia variegata]
MTDTAINHTVEDSALYTKNNKAGKGRPWCDHCKKPGHLKTTCWKLHGKPADWKPARNRANAAVKTDTSIEESPFTKEQIDALQKMLEKITNLGQTTAEQPTSLFAHQGISFKTQTSLTPHQSIPISTPEPEQHPTIEIASVSTPEIAPVSTPETEPITEIELRVYRRKKPTEQVEETEKNQHSQSQESNPTAFDDHTAAPFPPPRLYLS